MSLPVRVEERIRVEEHIDKYIPRAGEYVACKGDSWTVCYILQRDHKEGAIVGWRFFRMGKDYNWEEVKDKISLLAAIMDNVTLYEQDCVPWTEDEETMVVLENL